MRHRTRNVTVLFLLAFVAAGISAQTRLNVESAVGLAVRNNLSLQRNKITADAKKRAVDRSWNVLLPTVTAKAGASRANSDSLAANEWTPYGSAIASITLSPSVVSGMEQIKADYEAGRVDFEGAKRSLELSTREAFNRILLLKANIDIARQKLETAKSQYEQTNERAKIGQVPRLDALSARVYWETLKPTLQNVVLDYETAVDDFKRTIGLSLDEEIDLDGALATSATKEAVAGAAQVGEPLAVASLKKSMETTVLTKRTVRDGSLMPYLSLSYGASPTYSPALEDWYDAGSFSAAIGISLDGFVPGSSTQEKLAQYDDAIASLASRIEEERLVSRTKIRQLKRAIGTSFSSIEAQELNVRLAEESYALYEEAYGKGTSDFQSLAAARDTLDAAKVGVMQENYNLANSVLELENELNLPFGTLGRN